MSVNLWLWPYILCFLQIWKSLVVWTLCCLLSRKQSVLFGGTFTKPFSVKEYSVLTSQNILVIDYHTLIKDTELTVKVVRLVNMRASTAVPVAQSVLRTTSVLTLLQILLHALLELSGILSTVLATEQCLCLLMPNKACCFILSDFLTTLTIYVSGNDFKMKPPRCFCCNYKVVQREQVSIPLSNSILCQTSILFL